MVNQRSRGRVKRRKSPTEDDFGWTMDSIEMSHGNPRVTFQAERADDFWRVRFFNLLELEGVSWKVCFDQFELLMKGVMPKGEPNKSTAAKKPVKKSTKQGHAEAVASVQKALSK